MVKVYHSLAIHSPKDICIVCSLGLLQIKLVMNTHVQPMYIFKCLISWHTYYRVTKNGMFLKDVNVQLKQYMNIVIKLTEEIAQILNKM